MFVSIRTGERVHPVGSFDVNETNVDRIRDMTMVAMTREGWSQGEIGIYLNVDQRTVGRRLAAIPPDVRRYLEEHAHAVFGDMFDKRKAVASSRSFEEEDANMIVRESDNSQAVERLGVADDSPEAVDRLVDVLALALSDLGLNPRRVGHVVGLSEAEAKRRLQEIPDDVRAYARSVASEL